MDAARQNITDCLRRYILANDRMRASPCGWQSCTPRDTTEWREYAVLSAEFQAAKSALWDVTDLEYDEDSFRDAVWNWRHWKVEARKCCWYQKSEVTNHLATETMGNLEKAESRLAEVCGLSDLYRSSCSYIEAAFPNLKSESRNS